MPFMHWINADLTMTDMDDCVRYDSNLLQNKLGGRIQTEQTESRNATETILF